MYVCKRGKRKEKGRKRWRGRKRWKRRKRRKKEEKRGRKKQTEEGLTLCVAKARTLCFLEGNINSVPAKTAAKGSSQYCL